MDDTYVRTLTITNPPQYGVKIEKEGQISKSIFHSTYVEALKNVSDIIETNDQYNEENEGYQNGEIGSISPELFNTIVAFVGKRGSGKSTAMCSFSNMLSELNFKWSGAELSAHAIKDKHFRTLDAIDSAQLGVKETIIGRISAAMYARYQNCIAKDSVTISAEKKRNFIKKLSDVNKYAVMYHTGEWFKNGESLLNDTYHISLLRNEMSELVKSFLRFVSRKDNIKDEYLVISVDDIDMGIENSYAIMEEIRKFLCIPNVIVLITLRMDQIHIALKAKFEKQLEGRIDSVDDKALIDDLAYRYAEKLFPHDRQHQMPILSADQLREKWKADFKIDDMKSSFVLYDVLHLIWRKTLLLLVCNSDKDHLLIPRNLRSLCNLVVFLRGLPDVAMKDGKIVEESKVDIEKLESNLKLFSQYLVGNIRSFEQEHISQEDHEFALRLISIIHNIENIPLNRINSRIVGDVLYYLKGTGEKNYYRKIFEDIIVKVEGVKAEKISELDILLDASMHPELISLGDLMFVIGKIDSKTRCRYIKYLIEVIRTLWSAKMTEEYYTKKVHNLLESDYGKTISDYDAAVGNLIVNPDVGFFNSKSLDIEVGEGVIQSFLISSMDNITPDWRQSRIFTVVPDKGLVHPMILLSNKDYRRILPYYSLDFVYRFYELLHDNIVVGDNKSVKFDEKYYLLYKKNEGIVFKTVRYIFSTREAMILNYLPQEFYNNIEKNLIKKLDEELENLPTIVNSDFYEKRKVTNKEFIVRLNRIKKQKSLNKWVKDISEKGTLTQDQKTSIDKIYNDYKKLIKPNDPPEEYQGHIEAAKKEIIKRLKNDN